MEPDGTENNISTPILTLKSLNHLMDNSLLPVKNEVKTELYAANPSEEPDLSHMDDDDDTETVCDANEINDEAVLDDINNLEYILETGLIEAKPDLRDRINSINIQTQAAAELNTDVKPFQNPNPNPPIENVENNGPYLTFKSDDSMEDLYKARLTKKEKIAKDAIRKFAEFIKYRYEPFMQLINLNENKYNGYFCEFDPPRQCPIEKSLSGRWKLKFDKIVVANGNVTGDLTPENSRVVYSIKRTNDFVKEEEQESSDIPPYINHLMKLFEEFLNNSEVVQRLASRDPGATKNQRKEFIELHLRSNYQHEIMAIVIGYNVTQEMIRCLREYFSDGLSPNLKSLFLRIVDRKQRFTDFIYGNREIVECIGPIRMKITPYLNFYSNVAGIELLSETIYNKMKSYDYHTVLVVGGGLGLVNLLLSTDIKDVFGIEERNNLKDAVVLRDSNEIYNVRYVEVEDNKKMDMMFNELQKKKFFVVIDNNSNVGRLPSLMERIHKVFNLKHLVVVSTFQMHHAKSLDKFFEPLKDDKGYPFFPIKGCIVDATPASNHYQTVVVFERYAILKLSLDKEGVLQPEKDISKKQPPKSLPSNSKFDGKNVEVKTQLAEDRKRKIVIDDNNKSKRSKDCPPQRPTVEHNIYDDPPLYSSDEDEITYSRNARKKANGKKSTSNNDEMTRIELLEKEELDLRRKQKIIEQCQQENLVQIRLNEKVIKKEENVNTEKEVEEEEKRRLQNNDAQVYKKKTNKEIRNLELESQDSNSSNYSSKNKESSVPSKSAPNSTPQSMMKIIKNQEETLIRLKGLFENNMSKFDKSAAKKMRSYFKAVFSQNYNLKERISSSLNLEKSTVGSDTSSSPQMSRNEVMESNGLSKKKTNKINLDKYRSRKGSDYNNVQGQPSTSSSNSYQRKPDQERQRLQYQYDDFREMPMSESSDDGNNIPSAENEPHSYYNSHSRRDYNYHQNPSSDSYYQNQYNTDKQYDYNYSYRNYRGGYRR